MLRPALRENQPLCTGIERHRGERDEMPGENRTLDLRLERPKNRRMASGLAPTMRQICDLSSAVVSTEGQDSTATVWE